MYALELVSVIKNYTCDLQPTLQAPLLRGVMSFKSIRCIAISDVMKGISRDQTRVSADTVNLDDYTEVY